MDVKELFKGIAVVIDDEIHDTKASIYSILNQFREESIPFVEYESLPDMKIITHLHNISFILLDWQLFNIGEDIPTMQGLSNIQDENDKVIIDFLGSLLKVCFCPIFIFTTLAEEDIVKKLKENDIYNSSKNIIFIKHKDSVKDSGKLFEELNKWISSNAVIYLLKQWDNAYQIAKENLFMTFQQGSSNWVKVLCDTLKNDGDSDYEIAIELFNILQKNIYNRICIPQLETSILQSDSEFNKEDVIRVIEQTKFLSEQKLNPTQANTGDMFFDSDENIYYLNIRPQCDLLRSKNPELYCLKGKELKLKFVHDNCYIDENDTQDKKKEYIYQDGEFVEQKNNCIISYIFSGKIIEFKFRNLKILKWKDINSKRVGKLLPPFITHIRQKYATYIEREGLPRLPEGILDEVTKEAD